MSKVLHFNYRGISSEKYNIVVQNEGGALALPTLMDFSNNFDTPMYQNVSYFLGTEEGQKTWSFQCAANDVTIEQQREILNWLDPHFKAGKLYLDISPDYYFIVKVDSMSEATFLPQQKDKTKYTFTFTVSFITVSDNLASSPEKKCLLSAKYDSFDILGDDNLPLINYRYENNLKKVVNGSDGTVAVKQVIDFFNPTRNIYYPTLQLNPVYNFTVKYKGEVMYEYNYENIYNYEKTHSELDKITPTDIDINTKLGFVTSDNTLLERLVNTIYDNHPEIEEDEEFINDGSLSVAGAERRTVRCQVKYLPSSSSYDLILTPVDSKLEVSDTEVAFIQNEEHYDIFDSSSRLNKYHRYFEDGSYFYAIDKDITFDGVIRDRPYFLKRYPENSYVDVSIKEPVTLEVNTVNTSEGVEGLLETDIISFNTALEVKDTITKEEDGWYLTKNVNEVNASTFANALNSYELVENNGKPYFKFTGLLPSTASVPTGSTSFCPYIRYGAYHYGVDTFIVETEEDANLSKVTFYIQPTPGGTLDPIEAYRELKTRMANSLALFYTPARNIKKIKLSDISMDFTQKLAFVEETINAYLVDEKLDEVSRATVLNDIPVKGFTTPTRYKKRGENGIYKLLFLAPNVQVTFNTREHI